MKNKKAVKNKSKKKQKKAIASSNNNWQNSLHYKLAWIALNPDSRTDMLWP